MMSLLRGLSRSARVCGISRVLRVQLISTSATIKSSPPPPDDNLFRRISPLGDPKQSMFPVLDKWVEEGRPVEKQELQRILRTLRSYKRFKQALEISEWMTDKRYFFLSAGDAAIRLDLISKVHGEEAAEKYFNYLSDSLRVHQVYGALLNCYAGHRSVTKAESTMQKMKEMGFLISILTYNVMLNLYFRVGDHQKFNALVQEMETNAIDFDTYSLCIRLNVLAAVADVDGIEKLLIKMEADPTVSLDSPVYITAANAFLKVGVKEKAYAALKKAEHVRKKTGSITYKLFLTLYAEIGKIDEVYRIWDLYNRVGQFQNMVYHCMISSLLKLNDLDGAVEIWKEWETRTKHFDFRIPNLLITAYRKKGLLEEAEALFNRAMESTAQPTAGTWNCMASVYSQTNQMEKAVETVKKAILVTQSVQCFNRSAFAACLDYLKGKGRMDVAEELVNLCREQGIFSINMHQEVLCYLNNGKQGLKMSEIIGVNAQDHDHLDGPQVPAASSVHA